jgi:uncharacterized protein with GYD domain
MFIHRVILRTLPQSIVQINKILSDAGIDVTSLSYNKGCYDIVFLLPVSQHPVFAKLRYKVPSTYFRSISAVQVLLPPSTQEEPY